MVWHDPESLYGFLNLCFDSNISLAAARKTERDMQIFGMAAGKSISCVMSDHPNWFLWLCRYAESNPYQKPVSAAELVIQKSSLS